MTPAEAIRAATVKHLGVLPDEISDDATFAELGADSLDGISIAMTIEDMLAIEVPDDVITATETVGDAIKALERIVAGPKQETF